jgi:tRNA A37 threonylcarbamoyladenosine modification protein TsaB
MGSPPAPARRAPPGAGEPLLVLDSASPTTSVAIAAAGRLLAERREPIARSSVRLLPMIDEALREAGTTLARLAGLVALAGPGSFTGLRVGMATALGLHPAAGVPDRPLFAVVDVLRGEWAVQEFAPAAEGAPPSPSGEPERIATAELLRRAADADGRIAGFGVAALGEEAGPELCEPEALAAAAARELSLWPLEWDPSRLTEPLYFRPPAVTLPR